jgi:hypothetical protein
MIYNNLDEIKEEDNLNNNIKSPEFKPRINTRSMNIGGNLTPTINSEDNKYYKKFFANNQEVYKYTPSINDNSSKIDKKLSKRAINRWDHLNQLHLEKED